MLKLDEDKLKELKQDLTEFKGYLPFRFDSFINLRERDEYLKSIGLFETVRRQDMEMKYELMGSKDPDAMMDALILKFIDENPKFRVLIAE